MAAFAPIPSASDRMATTVTKGVRKSVRNASFRFRMNHLDALRSRSPATGIRQPRGANGSGATTGQVAPGCNPARTALDPLGGDGQALAGVRGPSERQAEGHL